MHDLPDYANFTKLFIINLIMHNFPYYAKKPNYAKETNYVKINLIIHN
jgi:hypothetical protein